MKVGSYKQNGVHKILEIFGKGGKERLVPLHKEAEERLEAWLDTAGIRHELVPLQICRDRFLDLL